MACRPVRLDAEIILDAECNERLVTDDLDDLLTRLEPVAVRLSCTSEPGLGHRRSRGGGVTSVSEVAAATGVDLVAVVDSVVRRLHEP